MIGALLRSENRLTLALACILAIVVVCANRIVHPAAVVILAMGVVSAGALAICAVESQWRASQRRKPEPSTERIVLDMSGMLRGSLLRIQSHSRPTSPLGNRVFRRLLTSYAINELGDWMGVVALAVLVFDQTNNALATAGLFLGAAFLPALIAPRLVWSAEKPLPRLALPLLYCGEAAAFGGLAYLANHFSLAGVITLAAIDGALALTGRALTRSVVVSVLEPKGQLRSGHALLNLAFTGAAAVGPLLAGFVITGIGVQKALLLSAISYYAIAWSLLTVGPLPRSQPELGQLRERVRAGLAYIRDRVVLRRLMMAQSLAFIFFSAVIPIEVIYAKQTLGTTDFGFGVMLGSWGVGMIFGGLIFAAIRRAALPSLLFFSTLAVGTGYLGLAFAPTLAVACVAAMVGGAGNGVQSVSTISAVQEMTTEGMQARVLSVLEAVGSAMPGIGFALGGVVAATFSVRTTFLVAGLGIALIAVVAVPLLGRHWPRHVSSVASSPDEGEDDEFDDGPGSAAVSSTIEKVTPLAEPMAPI